MEVRPGLEVTITRQLKGSKAELTFSDGREPVSGSDAVNQAILDLLGVDKSTLKNIVFVGQDELGSLLYSRDAERERLAQQFFGVEQANRIERLVGERINSKLLVANPVPTNEIEETLSAEKVRLACLESRLTALDVPADAPRLAELEREIANWNVHQQYHTRLQAQTEQKTKLDAQIAAQEVIVDEISKPLVGIEITTVEARLEQEKKKRWDWLKLHSLKEKNVQDKALLDSMVPPCTQEFIDGLVAEYHQLRDLKAADAVVPDIQRKLLNQLESTVTATCPVCTSLVQRGVESEPIRKALEEVRDVTAKISSLPERQNAITDWTQKLGSYQYDYKTVSQRLEQNIQEAEALAGVTEDGAVEKWTGSLEYIRGQFAKLSSEGGVLNSLRSQRSSIGFSALEIPAGAPAAGFDLPGAQLEIADIRHRMAELAEVKIPLAATRATIDHLERQLAGNADIDASNRRTEMIRSELGKLRAAFHPDGVPHILVSRRAERMVAKINEYLGILRVPFTVTSSGGFNFEAIFPDLPSPIEIRELSGGQKDDLSLAFRFAACETFSATAGLLVLDEPTAALDVETKHHFANVLERLRDMAASLNMQFVVVTHDRQFMSCFDQVLDLGEN